MKGLAAFTLIEILVTIVLVGIMAGVSVYAIGNFSEDAQESADAMNMRTLQNQVEAYRVAEGAYPATLADLLNADHPYIRSIPGGESAWNYAADTGQVSRRGDSSSVISPQADGPRDAGQSAPRRNFARGARRLPLRRNFVP